MAVYREGYHFIRDIKNRACQVFNDAADIGVPVKKGDATWNMCKFVAGYRNEGEMIKADGSGSFYLDIELIDEWAVSDERKTYEEAKDKFRIHYTKLDKFQKKPYLNPQFRGMDGFIWIEEQN